jgi:hypothetical protein
MGRLVKAALYRNEHIEEYRLRSNRRIDSQHLLEDVTNVESVADCWERAAKRIKKIDPDGNGSLALLRELEMGIKDFDSV